MRTGVSLPRKSNCRLSHSIFFYASHKVEQTINNDTTTFKKLKSRYTSESQLF